MFLLSHLYYASLLSHLIMCYNSLVNRQTQPFCLIKPLRKFYKTIEKVMPHRPLRTWRTVDARVHIDRYEHGERPLRDDFLALLPY